MRTGSVPGSAGVTATMFAASLCTAMLFGEALATVIHVPSEQPTIAAGLTAASPGDTLLLADGTYFEHGLVISQPVTIVSEHGAGYSKVDGEFAGRLFLVDHVDGLTLSRLTLSAGQADYGGAVYADSSHVAFDICVFFLNGAAEDGGAVFYHKGTGALSGCNFASNSAARGGGGVVVDAADVTFYDCSFTDNEAWWGGGACIYHAGATPSFEYCSFNANRAVAPPGYEPYGAGAYCWDHAAPSFSDCSFTDNVAGHGGGGLMSDEECTIFVTNCTFEGNSAVVGAGLETWWTRGGSVAGCDFIGNTADEYGGGVLYEQSQDVLFSDCSFTGNTAGEAGGGLDFDTATPGPSDCTFTGNSAFAGGAMSMEYSIAPTITGCMFSGNSAFAGGAVSADSCASPSVVGCTMVENSATYGGAIGLSGCSTPSVSGSTLVLNSASSGGAGVVAYVSSTLAIEQTIIGFSTTGEAVLTDGSPVSCATTAIYGNTGGDWVDAVAGQEGSDYNIATDPFLCGVLSGDYTLCEDSPCLPDNNGANVLVGAYDQGCSAPCGAAVERTSWGAIKALYR
jgi:predicted outer membrane repeat protein